jgi:hypothetical protein
LKRTIKPRNPQNHSLEFIGRERKIIPDTSLQKTRKILGCILEHQREREGKKIPNYTSLLK